MKRHHHYLTFICLFYTSIAFSWNGVGHRLIAQIAYDNLTRHAKTTFNRCSRNADQNYASKNFVNSAVWLDSIRAKTHAYDALHYIDIPFSTDGSPLPAIAPLNAVEAVEKSKKVLLNPNAKAATKGTALRILLHVVGDVHQPLHAVTRVSKEYPEGDKGGNLVVLHKNRIAKNLHSWWDKGGGLFVGKRRYGEAWIKQKAAAIEEYWPCSMALDLNAMHWAQESNALAIQQVYALSYGNTLDRFYQQRAQQIVQQRIALAGCRLAGVMNEIDASM